MRFSAITFVFDGSKEWVSYKIGPTVRDTQVPPGASIDRNRPKLNILWALITPIYSRNAPRVARI